MCPVKEPLNSELTGSVAGTFSPSIPTIAPPPPPPKCQPTPFGTQASPPPAPSWCSWQWQHSVNTTNGSCVWVQHQPLLPQKRVGRRLEDVAKAVGGGYCRRHVPWRLALAVRETVAGHRLGALEGEGGVFRGFPGISNVMIGGVSALCTRCTRTPPGEGGGGANRIPVS